MAKKEIGSDGAKITKRDRIGEAILATFFLIICFITLVPLLNIVSISFSSKDAILQGIVRILPVGFNTEAYTKVFGDKAFIYSFGYSIALMLGVTFISMVMTILCAYPLSRSNLKGKSVITAFILFTMYFSPGIIPHYLNIKNLGLMGSVWALILPGALSAYNMIILRSFFQGIDSSLYEAAFLDGCSEFKTLIRIVLPLTTPALATLSLFYAVGRWNGFSDVLFYISDPKLFTVQLKLKQMLDSSTIVNPGESTMLTMQNVAPENIKAASIVISMLPMIIVYPFVQKHFTKGIMLGSVKG
jgi:putative aldouronate transport system permease protein